MLITRDRLAWGVVGFCLGVVLATVVLVLNRQVQPAAIVITPPSPPPSPTAPAPPTRTPTTAPVVVHVSGAVRSPGLVTLPPGSRVGDAIAAAGGLAEDAQVEAVNLARPLSDGLQIYVPAVVGLDHAGATADRAPAGTPPAAAADWPIFREPEPAPGDEPPAPGSLDPAVVGPVNINTAGAPALESLPGIGPSTAAKIIAYREANGPFATIEAIMNVSGIGPARFEQIRALITVADG